MKKLVGPEIKYQESFLQAVEEYQEEYRETGNQRLERYAKLDLNKLRDKEKFGEFVDGLKAQAKGAVLPEGCVPNSVYWLVDGEEFIGWVDIRHRLTPQLKRVGGHIGYDIRPSKRRRGYGKLILKLAIEKARELGIKEILITCDATNIGSKKVIEVNGGQLENLVKGEAGQPDKLRYWIN